jgi:hypothetical protein
MNRRIVIASAGSIAAVLAAGAAAFSVTVGPSGGATRASADAVHGAPQHPGVGRVVTVYVDDPPAETADAASGAPAHATAHPAAAGAPVSRPQGAPPSDAEADRPAAAPVPSTAARDDDPVTTTPTIAAPIPTSAPAPSCTGSDDGLTEAQKQAREAACGHHGGDD